ncbi:MAG: adenylate/guanylate cyclase domain-containing protein, partial [Candidatus Marinimicrobia bacterium]|nr:adenylate/guanylate cyclase domain-containing protein [Candidatus Neomarinimicrobiota bacterium]
MPIERKLAAIMFTDIAGFTKIMGDDESTALSILENQQSLINPIIKEHKGTIIKKMGDGLLIEFPSTVESVECAIQMQDSIKSYNMSDDNLEFHIRIGIHLGDIVILG